MKIKIDEKEYEGILVPFNKECDGCAFRESKILCLSVLMALREQHPDKPPTCRGYCTKEQVIEWKQLPPNSTEQSKGAI
ncbi:MAG: hypothetical protein GY861_28080 [bacterium]|nr:hypothetical protein [bacterium]